MLQGEIFILTLGDDKQVVHEHEMVYKQAWTHSMVPYLETIQLARPSKFPAPKCPFFPRTLLIRPFDLVSKEAINKYGQYYKLTQLVTGCSSGSGKAFAKRIYSAGHRVVATARNIAALSYLPDGPTVLKLSLDVTSRENIILSLTQIVNHFGRIDVVINNAGYGLMGDTEAIEEVDARHQLETNFWGPVHIMQEEMRVFREMNPRGQGGTIIQISSMGGWLTAPGHAFYHAGYAYIRASTKRLNRLTLSAVNLPLKGIPSRLRRR